MQAPDAKGDPREEFGRMIRGLAPSSRRPIAPPGTKEGWDDRLGKVRAGLKRSFGRTPEADAPLDPEVLGTIRRDGYAIERLTFQGRPGVRVTANFYRPDPAAGRLPAVLCVHGHWRLARIDPVVQARCIGLARLGFACLCVDAFGSGERAIEPGPGTYHGGLVGASLWPAGTPLLGLQVYDNRRAVDYLISRPEVDPGRIGITGASGGGNQSLYAGATDDRLKAVVPVCGIGTLEAYLAAACCVCEVNPGALTYATTGDLLALMAPRALLVINATRDAFQFSVGEAAKSIAYARERYRQLGVEAKVRHDVFESGHDYSKPMREAMYGWMGLHLKGEGDGKPVPEPAIVAEDPAALRCYPDGRSRPKAVVTIPEFARSEGLARIAALPPAPDHRQRWEADALRMKAELRDRVFGQAPGPLPLELTVAAAGLVEYCRLEITSERGVRLSGTLQAVPGSGGGRPMLAIVPIGSEPSPEALAAAAGAAGIRVVAMLAAELRALGSRKPATGVVAGAADHNEAEWGIWLGRPLLGQWAHDLARWAEAVRDLRRTAATGADPLRGISFGEATLLAARGPMALVPIVSAGLGADADEILAEDCPTGFVSPTGKPWAGTTMVMGCPGILEVADVAHLAALAAPKGLTIRGAVEPDGERAVGERAQSAFAFARKVHALMGGRGLRLVDAPA